MVTTYLFGSGCRAALSLRVAVMRGSENISSSASSMFSPRDGDLDLRPDFAAHRHGGQQPRRRQADRLGEQPDSTGAPGSAQQRRDEQPSGPLLASDENVNEKLRRSSCA